MDKKTGSAILLAATAAGAAAALMSWSRRRRAINVAGRVVLITGGSRGLGLVLARKLVLDGAKVALCARAPDELDRAREDLMRVGGDSAAVETVECDITDREQVSALVRTVEQRLGPVEILINNAGTIQVGPMETMTESDYDEAMKIHFWAPYYLIEAVLPGMRARRAGRIVNITSIGGKISVPHLLPYSASKFAMVGLSEGMRAELGKDGIYVTTVCPGLMRTGSPVNAFFKGQHRAEYAWFTVADSLPGLTESAEAAAEQIVDACRHGDAEIVLTLPAQVGAAIHGLFPGVVSDILSIVNRFLPAPGGIGQERRTGAESGSTIAPSILTALTRRAAEDNNEM